ncbi:hypothetical protein J6590_005375 [Homalodisca vitripennis]|nr:hypothetical protein J6590_005375 [Homalodisca vitripennis]
MREYMTAHIGESPIHGILPTIQLSSWIIRRHRRKRKRNAERRAAYKRVPLWVMRWPSSPRRAGSEGYKPQLLFCCLCNSPLLQLSTSVVVGFANSQ